LLDCTTWQHKDQPLHSYQANQHDLPLVTAMMRKPVLKKFETHHWATFLLSPWLYVHHNRSLIRGRLLRHRLLSLLLSTHRWI